MTDHPSTTATGNIQLRYVIEDDLPVFFEQQRDPLANEMAAFPARDHDSFMTHWKKIMGDRSVILKTILYDEKVAGNLVSWEGSGQREVGYWLGRDYWGKGIATKAVSMFLEQVKIRPLYAHVAKHNFASFRVLEKCGFKASGGDRVEEGNGVIEEYILKLEG